jgi:Ca2+-binding EF-hand superfamily protein
MDILSRDISIFMDINQLNYYNLYLMIDKDNNGVVSRKEMRRWLKRNINVKLNKAELNQVIMHFDKDNNKKITVTEFHNTVKELLKKNKKSRGGLQSDIT